MRDAETLTMSAKEVDRLEIIGRVVERRLTQRAAAARLGLSLRHVERLCHAFRRHGAAGLVSRKRGRPSNRKLAEAVRAHAVDLVRARYADFGPTLACEKLTEQHGCALSRETLRRWMDRRGAVDPPRPAATSASSTPAPAGVSGRARPDRWLRTCVV